MRIFTSLIALAFLCLAGRAQVSDTVTFENVVVRTNITLGGVARSTWPSGGSGSTNWVDSGTTNATLPGVASVYGLSATNVIFAVSTLSYSATTDLDLLGANYEVISLTGDVTFTTSNRGAGRWKVVFIVSDGSTRTLAFPAGWDFSSGTAPTSIAANKIAILTVFFRDNTDGNAIATYSVQDAVVGDVTGPASSADNALARFHETTGKIVQNSSSTLSDNGALTLTGSTITADEPGLRVTQTWNNSGVTFSALDVNVTNTASGSGSMLANFRAGGTTAAYVARDGRLVANIGSASAPGLTFNLNTGWGFYKASGLMGAVLAGVERARWTDGNQGYYQVQSGTNTVWARVGGTVSVNTTAVGNVGTGEDNLMTYSVGANVLGANSDYLRIKCSGSFAANGNTKQVKAYFGATQLFATGASAFNAGDWVMSIEIIRTGAATQIANVTWNSSNSTLISSASVPAPTETLTGAVTFKLTGEATDDNDIVQKTATVAWCKGQ